MKNTLLGQARRHEDELAAWRADEDERRHNQRKLKRKKTTQ